MRETKVLCKNCGQKHPIGEVMGIKKNLETDCSRFEPVNLSKKLKEYVNHVYKRNE